MTKTKKKVNRPDLTTRNLHAAKKVDALQELQIDKNVDRIEALEGVVRSLMDQVQEQGARLARLEKAVHNPLGLQT